MDHIPRTAANIEYIAVAARNVRVEYIQERPRARGEPPMLVFRQFFDNRRGRRCDGCDASNSFANLADILHRFHLTRNVQRHGNYPQAGCVIARSILSGMQWS
jgi:hypothetical protein